MTAVKTLRPPFIWTGKELVEDQRYQRWSEQQIRAMRAGTYDWKQHEEVRAVQ